tara:strand:- start:28129 stop:28638 length:510 start_codon:yes stop_codon:yes gene_type:complete
MAEETINEILEENQGNLEEEDNQTLLWATLGVGFGIDIFVSRIEQQINILRQAGLGDTAVIESLRTDLSDGGRIFGEFGHSIKRGIVSGVMQGARIGQDSVYGNQLMQWVSVGSPNICPDCAKRVGEIRTFQEWLSLGLPATGWSICREFCYCQIIPEDIEIESRIEIT